MGEKRFQRRNAPRQVHWRILKHQNIAGADHVGAAKQAMRVVKPVAAMGGLVPALLIVGADGKVGVRDQARAAHVVARCRRASTATTRSA